VHKPFLDSNILVNLLSLNIKNKKFRTNVKIAKLFQKRVVKNISDHKNKSVNYIPTYLSGLKIRIGGRLLREALIQKLTKKRFERGASSIGKVNFLDSASITNKNRKGSYTLKISTGQNFF
jgi:Mitochondrial ribosomal protein (VAR1)